MSQHPMSVYLLFVGILLVLIFNYIKRLKQWRRIEELEKRNKELQNEIIFDGLTRLYSRRFLEDRLIATEKEVRRIINAEIFILFIDLDHFKRVNDTYGHSKGDEVLSVVGQTVMESVRENDVAARWGGEEIIVLGRGNGAILAERIRSAIENKTIGLVRVTVSIGMATLNQSNETLGNTIARADKALYIAKKNGRNCVVMIDK